MEHLKNAIFISYRRADLSQDQVNVIHEGLEKEFGDGSVFLDTSDIHSGAKWKEVLNQAGTNAKICLVMIGQNWLEKNHEGGLRIQDEGDWVRKEIEYAIEKKLAIIPVLVNGSTLPKSAELPATIREMLDSQTMRLDLQSWSIYKEKFIKDLKLLLGAKENSSLSFLNKWWLVFLPIIAGITYLFVRSTSHAPPVTEPTVTASSIQECEPFTDSAELKTLIFPIISSENEKLEYTLEREFTKKCQKYDLNNDNNIAEFYRDHPATLSDQKLIARRCAADLYFSGQLLQMGTQRSSMADFGLSDDALQVMNASAKDFSLTQSIVSLEDLTQGKAIDSLYENVLQYVLGLVAYRNKDFKKSVQIFKDLHPETLQSDTLKTIVYQLMADASIQSNQPDSAIMYLRKLNVLSPSNSAVILKTGVVAEKNKKPEIAIAAYTQLIDSSQYNKSILYERRGDLYNKNKDYQKAKEDYKKVDPQQVPRERLDPKVIEVDKKILQNNTEVSAVAAPKSALASDKILLSEKLLQLNQPAKALEILKTIDASSPQFKEANAILIEAQFKTNPTTVTTIAPEVLQARPSLKTAVEVQKVRSRIKN